MASSRALTVLIVLLATISVAAGCNGGGGTPPVNQAPTITNVTDWCAHPLASGSLGLFVVAATDPDGDALVYSFGASDGNVSASPSPTHPTWMLLIAPDVTADETVTLTFMVNDGNGGQDSFTEDLVIKAPEAGNSAPTISEFTIVPNPVPSGGTATVTTTATDLDGDALTYTYSWFDYAGFVIENSPGDAAFEVPDVTADTIIPFTVYVDDGHGHFVTAALDVTVQP